MTSYLSGFFEKYSISKFADLKDLSAFQPLREFFSQSLEEFELQAGPASTSVRVAIGKLLRHLNETGKSDSAEEAKPIAGDARAMLAAVLAGQGDSPAIEHLLPQPRSTFAR